MAPTQSRSGPVTVLLSWSLPAFRGRTSLSCHRFRGREVDRKPASARPASRPLVQIRFRGDNRTNKTRNNGVSVRANMIRLTKKLLFAIEAVLDIAYNGGHAPVRSSEITERQRIPRRYLEPGLPEAGPHQNLSRTRGPHGGL